MLVFGSQVFKFCKYQPFLANVKCFFAATLCQLMVVSSFAVYRQTQKNLAVICFVTIHDCSVLGVWSVLETTVTTPWAHKLGNSLGSWGCQVLVSKKAGWKKRNWLTESRGQIALSGSFRLLAPSEVVGIYHSFYVWHCLATSWAQSLRRPGSGKTEPGCKT